MKIYVDPGMQGRSESVVTITFDSSLDAKGLVAEVIRVRGLYPNAEMDFDTVGIGASIRDAVVAEKRSEK